MSRPRGKLTVFLAVVLILCVFAGGCLTVVGNILDNIDAMFNFVKGFGADELPENTVYGSANDLAVGFRNGEMVAFWDEDDAKSYEVKVTADDLTVTYSSDKNVDMFDGNYFLLEKADVTYADDVTVSVKKTASDGKYSEYTAEYKALTSDEYSAYTANVPGGFTDIDYYIADRYELFEFYAYALIFRPNAKEVASSAESYYEVTADIKLGYDFLSLYPSDVSEGKAFEAEIMCAVASFEDSAAYNYGYSYDPNTDVADLIFKFGYQIYPQYITDSKDIYVNATTALNGAHYEIGSHDRTFPVDEIEKTVTVSSSDQLYFAMKKGYRPEPVKGSNADYLYTEMKRVLSQINADNYSVASKVHNIYDYLVDTVIYDYEFVDKIADNESYGDTIFLYKCLYMEGVFGYASGGKFSEKERVAICDGLSKAFLCLTRIEGIDSIKVSGTTDGGAHAWNKVKVNNRWYMVDITWGNALAKDNREYLNHNYLMVPDDADHIEDKWFAYPKAVGSYSFIFG